MRVFPIIVSALLLSFRVAAAGVVVFSERCAGRVAVERVYHEHRTGTKLAFGEAMPLSQVEQLVGLDERKEATLAAVYGVEITAAMLEAEVRRIDASTRAPEMLAEIKAALGDDPVMIGEVFAKPVLVDRLLRWRFENDDPLHAVQRRLASDARDSMLAVGPDVALRLAVLRQCRGGVVQDDVTWELTARPRDEARTASVPVAGAPAAVKSSAGPYAVEATAQVAQVLSSPGEERSKLYFGELPADLQNVLATQLRVPGSVSAVIESPGSFQVYLARERDSTHLSAAVLTVAKRRYEEWIASQPKP